jgi:uncharacterized membrane protein
MNRNTDLLMGMLAGAGLMYLADPERGRRRRALARDRANHLLHRSGDAAGTTARDLRNRTGGLLAEAAGRVRSDDAGDGVVEARVRSALGRLVSHPGALHVRVSDGTAELSGPVLSDEVGSLLAGVSAVKGVRKVENRVEVHDAPGDVPGLQGRSRRPARRPELLQENWAPATRLVMGTLGGALALRGVRGDGGLDAALGLAGAVLLARAATNLGLDRLTGVNAGRRAIDVQKIVNVAAPVDEVFRFWSDFENLPRILSHLREVRMTDERRSHWVAELAAGVTVSWDAETTAFVQDEVIGWRSIGDSPVRSAGIVRFQPNPQGGTRVEVRLSYNPPAGAIGHAVAALFGTDPRHMLDDDMVRFKSLLEHGRATAHGRTVTREEVGAR